MTEDLRGRLHRTVGVSPSNHWLQDCLHELRLQQQRSSADLDAAVLQQILHHDLRDVIRTFEVSPSNNNNNHTSASASMEIRRAIRESQQAGNHKATTALSSPDVRLLIQIEELLDVSLNAEARLRVGPASANACTPIGNQANRCLKLACSDGYASNGSAYYDENKDENDVPPTFGIFAMEVAPIPQLSVNSYAGIKVLLTGPIEVRHGLLQLHPGNATVLGGQVAHLVELQQQALKQAQRYAGVGVDVTLRALVWNPDAGELHEGDDEGEGESRDVPQPHPHAPPPPPPPPPIVVPAAAPIRAPYIPPPPPLVSATQASAQHPHLTPAAALGPSMRHAPTIHARPVTLPRSANPYERSGVTPTRSEMGAPPLPLVVPRSIAGSSSNNNNNNNNPYSQQLNHHHQRNVLSQTTESSSGRSVQEVAPTAVAAPLVAPPPPPILLLSSNTTPFPQVMVFANLRQRLLDACDNAELYRHMFGQSFVVQLQQRGSKLYFNIEKKKKAKVKTSGDKHEFVLDARFGGNGSETNLITCRIASDLMRPYFGMSPTELRLLNKGEDKQKCEAIVLDGGKKIQEDFYKPGRYEVRLVRTDDEFFGAEKDAPPSLDGTSPILYIVRHA